MNAVGVGFWSQTTKNLNLQEFFGIVGNIGLCTRCSMWFLAHDICLEGKVPLTDICVIPKKLEREKVQVPWSDGEKSKWIGFLINLISCGLQEIPM